ncbi:MAG: PhnD/SsuA/transferrin family substrate-binding protein [bacterium]|nr:PhnD/SsuA/transferrin family substrate-binding protein [bacterium]
MRTRITSRAIVLGFSVLLLLALVGPATAAPPHNPFVGSWESIYDDGGPVGPSELHFQIGGRGHLHGRVDVGRICSAMYDQPTASSINGSGSIVSTDPYQFEAYADLYCHVKGQGRQLAIEDFYLKFQYEPDTGTLHALHYPPQALNYCFWRSGSDPSVCAPSLILPPSGEGVDVAATGQMLADALYDATGVSFSVVAADSATDVYNRMCALPATAVGIMPSGVYSLASIDCGVDASFRAVRFGSDGFFTQFMVPAGGGLGGVTALDGMTWAHPDEASMSGYLVPKGMMALAGVEPAASLNVGSHNGAVLAVYLGTAEFGTSFFDARSLVVGDYPDVYDVVELLEISPEIPNEPIAFGSQFPEGLRLQVEAALAALADPPGELWQDTFGTLYGWEGINQADDADWDWLRSVLDAAEFGLDDL